MIPAVFSVAGIRLVVGQQIPAEILQLCASGLRGSAPLTATNLTNKLQQMELQLQEFKYGVKYLSHNSFFRVLRDLTHGAEPNVGGVTSCGEEN